MGLNLTYEKYKLGLLTDFGCDCNRVVFDGLGVTCVVLWITAFYVIGVYAVHSGVINL